MKKGLFLFLLMIVFENNINAQVQVTTGWNLIGALTTIQASEVTTDPPGIIVSPFYGYNPNPGGGYYVATALEVGKGYWVKVSSNGIIYGFEPLFICGMSKVNYQYKYYSTVQIGTQCWLKENLDIGTMVPGTNSQQNNSVIEKYCYNNNETNCQLYGGLYQWDEAMQYVITPSAQGICPPGWHIPTLAEFQALKAAVNNDGNALKAIGQGTGGGAGTNISGFSALLVGYRYYVGVFSLLGERANFWSCTLFNPSFAYSLIVSDDDGGISLPNYDEAYGLSVRCLKD